MLTHALGMVRAQVVVNSARRRVGLVLPLTEKVLQETKKNTKEGKRRKGHLDT